MYYNVNYEYIHKGYREKGYQKYFLQIQTSRWIVVVTCVVTLIYMLRIDSDSRVPTQRCLIAFLQHGEYTQVCHFRAEVRRLLRLTVQLVPTAL